MASHPWLARRSTDWSSATWETSTSDRRRSLVLTLGQLQRKQTPAPRETSSMDLILGQDEDRTTEGSQSRKKRADRGRQLSFRSRASNNHQQTGRQWGWRGGGGREAGKGAEMPARRWKAGGWVRQERGVLPPKAGTFKVHPKAAEFLLCGPSTAVVFNLFGS